MSDRLTPGGRHAPGYPTLMIITTGDISCNVIVDAINFYTFAVAFNCARRVDSLTADDRYPRERGRWVTLARMACSDRCVPSNIRSVGL